MIQLYECPNCGKGSSTFTRPMINGSFKFAQGSVYCPACAPTPDMEPHDYRPIMLGGVPLEEANLISGVCCADAGDCDHECGIA